VKKPSVGGDSVQPKLNRVVELGRERKYVPSTDRDSFGPDPTSVEEINSVSRCSARANRRSRSRPAMTRLHRGRGGEGRNWVPEEKEEQEIDPSSAIPPIRSACTSRKWRSRASLPRRRGRHCEEHRDRRARSARPSSRFHSPCSTSSTSPNDFSKARSTPVSSSATTKKSRVTSRGGAGAAA